MRSGESYLSTRPSEIISTLRRNSECPQCGRYYLSYPNPHWKGDQSVCQACADKNFAFTRDKMQKIERAYADSELDKIEAGYGMSGPFVALSGLSA
jgi:hypothetical protein